MIAVTKCEKETAKRFKKAFSKYVPKLPPKGQTLPLGKVNSKGKVALGKAVVIPKSDIHHVFDNETMLAVSHAISDLASEVRTGELIASFQDFDHYLPHAKRYEGLALDLDSVRIWASGKKPKKSDKVDYVIAEHPKLQRYWVVLFKSEKSRAILLCKQINDAVDFDEKKFVGFYSFNPYLVQSISWRFNLLSCGLCNVIKHWEDEFPLPNITIKDFPELNDLIPAASKTKAKISRKHGKPVKQKAAKRKLSDSVDY